MWEGKYIKKRYYLQIYIISYDFNYPRDIVIFIEVGLLLMRELKRTDLKEGYEYEKDAII